MVKKEERQNVLSNPISNPISRHRWLHSNLCLRRNKPPDESGHWGRRDSDSSSAFRPRRRISCPCLQIFPEPERPINRRNMKISLYKPELYMIE